MKPKNKNLCITSLFTLDYLPNTHKSDPASCKSVENKLSLLANVFVQSMKESCDFATTIPSLLFLYTFVQSLTSNDNMFVSSTNIFQCILFY